MNTQQAQERVITIAAAIVAIAAAIFCLGLLYNPIISPLLDVLPPFVIAIIIAFLLDPVVDWLQRRGLSRGGGVAVVGLTFVVLFVLLGMFVLPKLIQQASGFASKFPEYSDVAQQKVNALLASHKAALTRFGLPTTTEEIVERYSTQLQNIGQKSLQVLSAGLSAVASRFLWLVIIPLGSLLLLKDLDYIKRKIVYLTPAKHQASLMAVSSAIGAVFGQYIRGMLIVALLYSAVTSVVLSLFGLNYALIIGMLSGLFYLIYLIGPLVTITVIVFVSLTQAPNNPGAAGLLALVMAIQNYIVFDQILFPRIVGGSVHVHPVLTLFSLALGARMFGIPGMIIAVPFVASVQVALAHFYPNISEDIRQKPILQKPVEETEEESDSGGKPR